MANVEEAERATRQVEAAKLGFFSTRDDGSGWQARGASSPSTRGGSGARQRHDSDSDAEPVIRKQRHDSDSDAEPMMTKQRHDSDSDAEPARRNQNDDSDSDAVIIRRKQRHDSDEEDASPPRRGQQDSDADMSPPRRSTISSPPLGICQGPLQLLLVRRSSFVLFANDWYFT